MSRWPGMIVLGFVAAIALTSCDDPATYIFGEEELRQLFRERLGDEAAAGIEIPFQLDDGIREYTDRITAYARTDSEKVNLILDAILSRIGGGVKYDGVQTRNAVETYREATGNCLSFTNLFVGMARHARLPVAYLMVDEVDDFEWAGGVLVHQKHMCAGLVDQGRLIVVDFVKNGVDYWQVRPIADNEAVAFFYNNLGYNRFKEGDMEGAVKLYRTAIALAPDLSAAHNNLGVALTRQGKLEEAIAVFRHAALFKDGDLSVHSNLAAAFRKHGDTAEADRLAGDINKIQSSSPYNLFVKARLLRQQGDLRASLRLLKKANRRGSDNLALKLELARVYFDMGDRAKALKEYRKVLRLDSRNFEAQAAVAATGP